MLPYKTAEEANERMAGTVCLFKGDPVYVNQIHIDCTIDYATLPLREPLMRAGNAVGAKNLRASMSDINWSCSDFRLGYLNGYNVKGGRHRALYIQRIPARQWKQGLNAQNTIIDSGDPFGGILCTPEFNDMIHGVYPTSDIAKQYVVKHGSKDISSCAFNRQFCIQYGPDEVFWINYKGIRVASSHDPEQFHLPKKYEWLKEAITEQGLKVG